MISIIFYIKYIKNNYHAENMNTFGNNLYNLLQRCRVFHQVILQVILFPLLSQPTRNYAENDEKQLKVHPVATLYTNL